MESFGNSESYVPTVLDAKTDAFLKDWCFINTEVPEPQCAQREEPSNYFTMAELSTTTEPQFDHHKFMKDEGYQTE